jgi:hypothetical protein
MSTLPFVGYGRAGESFVLGPAGRAHQERHANSRTTHHGVRGHVMFKIGQGGQVVGATGEGVRLRPLADALSDASGLPARGSGSGLGPRS